MKYAESLLTFRYWVLGFLILTTIFLSIPLANMGVEMDNSAERFAVPDDPSFSDLKALQERFGRDDFFAILIKGEVFSSSFFHSLKDVDSRLQGDDFQCETASVLQASLIVEEKGKRKLVPWGDIPTRELPMAELLKGAAHLDGKLLSSDAAWTVIWCQPPMMDTIETGALYAKLEALQNQLSTEEFFIQIAGGPAFTSELDRMMQMESQRLSGMAFLLMILFLGIYFRKWSMIVGPFLVMALGVMWTFSLIALYGLKLSYMTSILPGFLISVCVGDSIHIQALVKDALDAGKSKKDAILEALKHSWLPILFTTLTTAIGLLSFRFASLPAIVELGTFGATGAVIAFLLSVLIIPCMISLLRLPKAQKAESSSLSLLLNRFLRWCLWISKGGRASFLIFLAMAAVLFSVYGVSQLKVDHDPMSWMPSDNKAVQGMRTLDDHLGGSSEFTLYIRSQDGKSLLRTSNLQTMYEWEQRILDFEHSNGQFGVETSIGILDPLRLAHRMSGSPKTFDELMQDRAALSALQMRLALQNPLWANGFLDKKQQEARIVFRVPWQPAQSYLELRDFLTDEMAKEDRIQITAVGTVFNLLSTFGALVSDLLRSFAVALVVITILMMLVLRSLKLGLISMVPNLLPILYTMGAMFLLDIHFDLTTVLFASILLGICVDDTIHVLYHFARGYHEHGVVEKALEDSMKHAGKAILITSCLLIGCLGIYLFSDLASLRRFGLLMIISVSFAIIADLILTPILIRAFYQNQSTVVHAKD